MNYKVNISVLGRFHAFDLAKHLKAKCLLSRLITTYPYFKVKEWNLNSNNIVTEFYLEVLNRYRDKIPFISSNVINNFCKKRHAKNSSNFLSYCDIHIGWSGSSLETIIEAKRMKKIFILERGSSHYSYQMNILREENKLIKKKFNINYETWCRELLEYELSDYISVPSKFVKKTFIEQGVDEKKLLVNPYGVDLEKFYKIKKEDAVFRIIFTGSASLRKGYHYLLQAFYELNLPNCELWHLGSITEEIKPFIDKYKHSKWIFKGHKPQNELYKYYSQGDVFVMPSIEEGFAMVQFQAMACELPLICTTNTGGEDLISKDGEEGFVIPIRDVNALKEKILFMYSNQDIAKEMGKRAKQKIQKGYSWSDYGTRYINNLNKIWNKGGKS
jgi:glycosyltransferase involved in cell wall biosynthesis